MRAPREHTATLERVARLVRFRAWVWRLRSRCRRAGIQLVLDVPKGGRVRGRPRVEIVRTEHRGGRLELALGAAATFGPGVVLRVRTGEANALRLGEGVTLAEGVHVWLHGGEVDIGRGAIVRERAVLKSSGRLEIGSLVRIGYSTVIHCHDRVSLGDRVVVADLVVAVDSDHPHDGSATWFMDHPVAASPISIGANTLVGAHATLTRGAEIGPCSLVAARSLVRAGTYEEGWLLAGTPATPKRRLEQPGVGP